KGEVVVTVGIADCRSQIADLKRSSPSSENLQSEICNLQFTVRDTGIGIPAEKQGAIFAPFVQADGSMSRRYGGTGLGLSISVRLVELMGGTLGLESEPGKGTKFFFTLPLPPSTEPRPGPTVQRNGSLRGLHVLIVDDNATNRRILIDMTRSWGLVPVA